MVAYSHHIGRMQPGLKNTVPSHALLIRGVLTTQLHGYLTPVHRASPTNPFKHGHCLDKTDVFALGPGAALLLCFASVLQDGIPASVTLIRGSFHTHLNAYLPPIDASTLSLAYIGLHSLHQLFVLHTHTYSY